MTQSPCAVPTPHERRTLGESRGFTLIEVLLTVGILSVVMIPLLLWSGLVFTQSKSTVNDETNSLTLISNYLTRDASGVADVASPSTVAADQAAQAKYAGCGMPPGADTVLELTRPADAWVVYYTTTSAGKTSLHRLRCTSDTTVTPATYKGDDTVLADSVDGVASAVVKPTQVRVSFKPAGVAAVDVRVERNVTQDQIQAVTNQLQPAIDCAPSCAVNRQGSPLGASDANSLKASVSFNARLSRSESSTLPITHYQWVYGDGTTDPVRAVSTSPLATAFNHVYDCRSVAVSAALPRNSAWDNTTKACEFNAVLTVWSGGAGATPTAGSASATVSQKVQVRNNAPRVVVNPPSAVVPSYSESTFSATGTSDVDGLASGLTYEWDFGDPATGTSNVATGVTVTHTYNLPVGTAVEATLTVTDDDGAKAVVAIPVVVNASTPTVLVDLSCSKGTGDVCTLSNTEPFSVTFNPSRTVLSDPSARITHYEWSFPDSDTGWVATPNGTVPVVTHSFERGTNFVWLSIRTEQKNRDGSFVEGSWLGAINVKIPPAALVAFRPGQAITPTNVNIDPAATDQARFVLDGSMSYDNNPSGGLKSYVWEVRNSSGGLEYRTPDDKKLVPIIGCTGYETPGATPGAAWTVSAAPINASSVACSPFKTLAAGVYDVTLTVTNMENQESTADAKLKVNVAPTNVNVAGVAALNNSVATACAEAAPSTCVYRKLAHTFNPTTPSDPDASPPPFRYDWKFTGDQGTTFSSTDTSPNLTFNNLGETVHGVLTVTDGDGGLARTTFDFKVQNQKPKATTVSVVSPGPAPTPTFPLNVFTNLTPTDKGTVTLSTTVSDPDSTQSLMCTWEFPIDATPSHNVVFPPQPCSQDKTFSWGDYASTWSNTHNVKVTVTDDDGGSGSTTSTIAVRKRPIAKFTNATAAAGENTPSVTVSFDVATAPNNSSDPNGGTPIYWWNFGDDCDANGANCKLVQAAPVNGKVSHTFTKASCATDNPRKYTNTGSCGKWAVYLYVESSLSHAAYGPVTTVGGVTTVPEPSLTSSPPNGWSDRSAPLTVRLNTSPKLIFGNNGQPSSIDSRVLSPLGPDGNTAAGPGFYISNSVAAMVCGSGTNTCTYKADGTQSWDPDGSKNIPGVADNLDKCTGALQAGAVPATTTCLKYKWTGSSGVAISGDTTATPTITYTRPGGATAPIASGYFTLTLVITDNDNGTVSGSLAVADIAAPTVGANCAAEAFGTLPRGVDVTLDGLGWGKRATSPCLTTLNGTQTSTVSQLAHYTGIGQFNGPLYGGKGYDMTLKLTPASGGNPATIVRTTGSFVADKFLAGSTVNVRRTTGTQINVYGVVSSVTDSTLTFSSTSAAFVPETGAVDVQLFTQCGGTAGQNCIPDHTDPAGTGVNAPNYVWTFTDDAGAGGLCNLVTYGRAAKVNFRPTGICTGKVSLKVTDENGATSQPASPVSFTVGDAPPVANINTTAPTVTTNPAVVVGNLAPFTVGFDGSASFDPDGGPNGATSAPIAAGNYSWDFDDPSSGADNTSTAASPSHTFNAYRTYNVKLTVKDAQSQTTTRTVQVKVYKKPTVDITATAGTPSSCTGPTVSAPTCTLLGNLPTSAGFEATSPVAFDGPQTFTYAWNFGDPGSNANNTATGKGPITHQFSNYGVYTVTLTVTDNNGIEGTRTLVVTVDQPPTVDIAAKYLDGSYVTCPNGNAGTADCSVNIGTGSANVELTATASSPTSGIATYGWDFGEGPTPPNAAIATHTYSGYGIRTVTLTVTTQLGAKTTKTFKVKVNQPPTAVVKNGSTSNPSSITLSRNVAYTSLTGSTSSDPDQSPTGQADNGIASWSWAFVDAAGSGGTCNGTFTGKDPSVTLVPTSSCTGTLTLTTTDAEGAKGVSATIPFTVTPSKPTVVITTDRPGDIGSLVDGGPAVQQTISLLGGASSQPGGGTITSYVWVVEDTSKPSVPASSCVSNPAQPACAWVDASGTNQTVRPPLPAGNYVAWLILTTANGQTNEGSLPFKVNAPPTARILATVTNNNGGCQTVAGLTSCVVINSGPSTLGPYSVSFTDNSSKVNGESPSTWTWSWNFGDTASGANNTSTQRNPVHVFSGYGTYTVTMTVTDAVGASATTTALVTVHRPPTATVAATYLKDNAPPQLACAGNAVDCSVNDGTGNGYVAFLATATAPDGMIQSYDWDFGDGTPHDSTTNPTHHFATYGTYTVKLTVTDDSNSTAVKNFVVKVNRLPEAKFTDNNAAPGTINLQRNTPYAKLSGATSTDADPTPTNLPDNGIKTWSWVFTDSTGASGACNGTFTGKVPSVTLNPAQVPTVGSAACTGTMQLTVTDYDLGTTTRAAVPFIVSNVKPVAVIEATTDIVGVAPLSPTFTPTGSNDPDTVVTPAKPQGDVKEYRWTVYKGAVVYRPVVVQTNFSDFLALENDPLTEEGTYSVELVVVDTHGESSTPATLGNIKVVKPPLPKARVNPPGGPNLPLPQGQTVQAGAVVLDGSQSVSQNPDPAVKITAYYWEVCRADSTGLACDLSLGAYHVYPVSPPDTTTASVVIPQQAGTYLVQLIVQDSVFATASTGYMRMDVRL